MIRRTEMDAAGDAAFERALTALIPHMRAFARSLTGNAATADDVAQDALAKAWRNRSSFEAGTNLKAWTFTIVRNQFYTDRRRDGRTSSLDPEIAESSLVATDDPSASLDLQDLRRALDTLPPLHREAIILVGAGGLTYEKAAAICCCPIGTIKSRVHRARAALQALLDHGVFDRDATPRSDPMGDLMTELDGIRCRPQRTGVV